MPGEDPQLGECQCVVSCVGEQEEKGGWEYKTQTTVPLADGPLAAALWGQEMESDDKRVGGMSEVMIFSISGEYFRKRTTLPRNVLVP